MKKPEYILRILFILLSFFFLQICLGQSNPWGITENRQGVLIMESADSVLFYQRKTKSLKGQFARANYIHPLYGLSNNVLTEDFPADHLHHRGIFWVWHQTYIGDKRIGDAWALENFKWDVADVRVVPYSDSCLLYTSVYWKSPLWLDDQGREKAFLQENAVLKIHAAQNDYRVIDFSIKLTALEDHLFIGGSEDAKGYGGFSWRIPLPEKLNFESENGEVKPQNLALEAGAWMNIGGNLDGNGKKEGVVVISHPQNPGHPQTWILREKGSMQNVVFPGRNKIEIPKERPLILQYRMIVYEGNMEKIAIQALENDFSGANPAKSLDLSAYRLTSVYQNDFSQIQSIDFEEDFIEKTADDYQRTRRPSPGAEWIAEGWGGAQIREGKLWAAPSKFDESGEPVSVEKKERSHMVIWNKHIFPEDFLLEFTVNHQGSDNGLTLMFFSASGAKGEDIFDLKLPPRRAQYRNYTRGAIANYSDSYWSRNKNGKQEELTNRMRKNPGFQQMTWGNSRTAASAARDYKLRILKVGGNIKVEIDGQVVAQWLDDNPLGSGRIGLRCMNGVKKIAYDDFKVWQISPKE